MQNLSGKLVAILVADGFEEVEFTMPKKYLEDAGAKTHVISLKSGKVRAWNHTDWSNEYQVDKTIDQVSADDYDALLLSGGVMNPDHLRTNEQAVSFTRDFFTQHKPVAAICHGPWTLAEAGVLQGRTVTSYPSIKTDLKNAGANWVDREVVVDRGLVTSRNPDDLPAFNAKLVEEVAEGMHAEQTA
jgi:protease I